MVDFHVVSVGLIVPSGVTNVFSINPLGRHIRWIFWHPSDIEGVDLYGCLLDLRVEVSNGCGEVCYGFALGPHRFPICRRRCCQVNEVIMGILLSLLEVVCDVLSCQPGGNFLLPILFTLFRLKVCLEVCPGFVGACLVAPLVTVNVK